MLNCRQHGGTQFIHHEFERLHNFHILRAGQDRAFRGHRLTFAAGDLNKRIPGDAEHFFNEGLGVMPDEADEVAADRNLTGHRPVVVDQDLVNRPHTRAQDLDRISHLETERSFFRKIKRQGIDRFKPPLSPGGHEDTRHEREKNDQHENAGDLVHVAKLKWFCHGVLHST